MPGLERLSVAISDPELHAIETVESFETPGTFLIEIANHGRDAHVHLALDDALAAVADLEETNVYVERDTTREVEVSVDPETPHTEGTVRIQTGYGAETESVAVAVGTPDTESVRVDETLGDPPEQPEEPDDAGSAGLPSLSPGSGWVPVAVLAAVALVLAAVTVALVSDPVVIAGVVVVLLGVLAAAAMLLRP